MWSYVQGLVILAFLSEKGWSCFKFNNFGLALCMDFKFRTIVAKAPKLKVRKFYGLLLKLQGKAGNKVFLPHITPPPSWLGLKVKRLTKILEAGKIFESKANCGPNVITSFLKTSNHFIVIAARHSKWKLFQKKTFNFTSSHKFWC